jgi:putative transposase
LRARARGARAQSWHRHWEQIIPFFAFSAPIRRAIYTTNAIESLDSTVRRAVRTRGHFPSDRAAAKLIDLALRNISERWKRPPAFWSQAQSEFAIRFGERFMTMTA